MHVLKTYELFLSGYQGLKNVLFKHNLYSGTSHNLTVAHKIILAVNSCLHMQKLCWAWVNAHGSMVITSRHTILVRTMLNIVSTLLNELMWLRLGNTGRLLCAWWQYILGLRKQQSISRRAERISTFREKHFPLI